MVYDQCVDRDSFRRLMSAFPTGVVVLTTRDPDGQPYGLTCSSLCSVTLTPPTLLICVHTGSRTLGVLRDVGVFAVNFLHSEGQPAAEVFAGAIVDRFSRLAWRRTPVFGLPHLHQHAHAVAECRLTGSHDIGDHTIILGTVTSASTIDQPPLLYGLRQYKCWAS